MKEFNIANARLDLAEDLQVDIEQLIIDKEEYGYIIFLESKSKKKYKIVSGMEATYDIAREYITDDLESILSYVDIIYLLQYIDKDNAKELFEDYYNSQNESYVEEIKNESYKHFTNRLAQELFEIEAITEKEACDEDFDLDEVSSKLVDYMTKDSMSYDGIGIEYYKNNFGTSGLISFIKYNNLIDEDDFIEDYLVDEVCYYIDSDDESIHETDEGFVYWLSC